MAIKFKLDPAACEKLFKDLEAVDVALKKVIDYRSQLIKEHAGNIDANTLQIWQAAYAKAEDEAEYQRSCDCCYDYGDYEYCLYKTGHIEPKFDTLFLFTAIIDDLDTTDEAAKNFAALKTAIYRHPNSSEYIDLLDLHSHVRLFCRYANELSRNFIDYKNPSRRIVIAAEEYSFLARHSHTDLWNELIRLNKKFFYKALRIADKILTAADEKAAAAPENDAAAEKAAAAPVDAALVDAASDVYKVFGGCQIPTTYPDNSQKP